MKEKATNLIAAWLSKYKGSIFLKNLSSVLIIDILARASGILLLPVYLRLMTQEEYGLYNYLLSMITTFAVILNFGLYVSQSKYYHDADSASGKKKVLFNIVFLLTFLLSLFIVPVYAFKLDYYLVKILLKNSIDYNAYRWPILLAVIVSVYVVIISNYFITSEKINQFRKYNIARLLTINLVAVTALWYFNNDKIFIRLLYTYLIELAVLLIFFVGYAREMLPVIDRKIITSSLKLGLPMMFSAIWGLVGNYSDKFFLEKYGSATDLSYYYLAFSLANIMYLICNAVQNVWMPRFLKEKNVQLNITQTNKLLQRLAIVLVILGIFLIAAFYIALKTDIISPKYWKAIYILPILLLAHIINGIVLLYSNYMVYFEKTHWTLFIGIFTSIIGAVGSYYLVPVWNVYGAAFVYLAVQASYFCIYHILIKYKLKSVQANLDIKNGENQSGILS